MKITLPATARRQTDGLQPAERLLLRLERYRRTGDAKWMACCPAHEDRTPSLSIRELPEEDGKLLIHCFAGCSAEDVLAAVGLDFADLFPDDPEWRPRRVGNGHVPLRGVEDARFTLEILRAESEAGRELSDTGRQEAIQAAEVLIREGIRPEWMPPDPAPPLPTPQPEFLELDFPPEEPILGPFKSQQLAMIYAPTGAGKTMFCLSLAAAMALQQDFLNWRHSGRRTRVLYVDGEMSAWELQRRLKGIQAPDLYLASSMALSLSHGIAPLNLATQDGQAILLEWVKLLGIDVVYLDNLMSLSWIDGVSINSDEAWRPVNHLLLGLRGMGKAAFVIDHANQSGQVHGTKTKAWHLDHNISISPLGSQEEDDLSSFDEESSSVPRPRILVSWKKHRGTPEIDEKGGTLTQEIVAVMDDVGQPWRAENSKEAMRREVLKMLEIGMPIRDIQEETGIPKSTIHRWKKQLIR